MRGARVWLLYDNSVICKYCVPVYVLLTRRRISLCLSQAKPNLMFNVQIQELVRGFRKRWHYFMSNVLIYLISYHYHSGYTTFCVRIPGPPGGNRTWMFRSAPWDWDIESAMCEYRCTQVNHYRSSLQKQGKLFLFPCGVSWIVLSCLGKVWIATACLERML